MTNFAIMRCAKLNHIGNVAAALQHCFRERPTLNADPARTPSNELLVSASSDAALGKLRTTLPVVRRKDAVLAVEYVMGASPEWWAQASEPIQQAWRDSSMAWIESKYGKANVIAAVMHRDELTPHLSVFVVPMTQDGRLSAKEHIGDRKKMTADQTTYAACVARLGLVRGVEGSRSTHQRVKAHYAGINQAQQSIPTIEVAELKPRKLPPETMRERLLGVYETAEGVTQRLNAKVRGKVVPIVEMAGEAAFVRQRAKSVQQTNVDLRKQVERYKDATKGLSPDQVDQVLNLASQLRVKNAMDAAVEKTRKERDLALKRGSRPSKDRGYTP